jgi:hypothetical protein
MYLFIIEKAAIICYSLIKYRFRYSLFFTCDGS